MSNPAKNIPERMFFAGLLLLAASLPLSMFTMSVSQFLMLGGWLLQGNLAQRLKQAFSNKIVLILGSVYFIHLAGLAYTTDFDYALNDLRIKLPLLLLPVLFASTTPLPIRQLKIVLAVFVSATFISTFISYLVYMDVIHRPYNNIRNISIFISHIRLSLLVCVAVYTCLWFVNKSRVAYKALLIAAILWFIFFLIILEAITGLGILMITLAILLIKYTFQNSSVSIRLISILFLMSAGFYAYRYIDKIWVELNTVNKDELLHLKTNTTLGNAYSHDTLKTDSENGHLIWINLCEQEMRPAWNNRSKLNYDSLNNKGDELRMTIIRFLTSKGIPKDGSSINSLNDKEINAIENGVANVDEMRRYSIYPRIRSTLWEIYQYQHHHNPSGYSLAMRFEFWKTALKIITDHPLTGVGTGDVPLAFSKKYDQTNSPLSAEFRLRAHNQYLTIAVALGLPALFWFLFSLISPGIMLHRFNHFLYLSFWITAMLSMLTEDTLETQAGVTFFVFFNSLFLFLIDEKET